MRRSKNFFMRILARFSFCCVACSVADPDPAVHSDANPDPIFPYDADPDPTMLFFPDLDHLMLQNDPLRLPPFHFDADPDPAPAFHFHADQNPASQNDANPCGRTRNTGCTRSCLQCPFPSIFHR